MSVPVVTSEKPSLPTLWLDTSVIIKLTTVDRGESLQAIEVERLTHLKELVRGLGEAGKLLCPQADQEEEYAGERLDHEVHGDFLSLSMGLSFRHRQGVFDDQTQIGMKACVEHAAAIVVPLDAYFYSDPAEELSNARQRSIVIGAHPIRDPEILARRQSAKSEIQRIWENLRQEFVQKKRSYEAQLREELSGYADAVTYQIRVFEEKIRSGAAPSFWEIMGAEGFLMFQAYWRDLNGAPVGLESLRGYFCSEYFARLPTPRIRIQLGAHLLTGNQIIETGDAMDVDLLSVAIPASHYVLTDKRAAERIKRRGIDVEWGTKVYSLSQISQLFEQLEALR